MRRSFGIDDPRRSAKGRELRVESKSIIDLQLASTLQPFDSGDKQLAKAFAEQLVVDQVRLAPAVLPRMTSFNPTIIAQRRPAARNECMHVRMVAQPLVSRVQHHHRRGLEAELFFEHFPQGLPRRLEQQVVHRAAIPQGQRRQLLRQCKHDLKVVHSRQQQRASSLDPRGSLRAAALRTMPIAAGVVNNTALIARLAFKQPAAQRRRAAER